MKPLRILYVVHAYKPAYRAGGPIVSVSAVAERLAARGHRVTVFTTTADLDHDLDVPADRPTTVDGVEVWYFARHEPFKRLLPFVSYLSRSFGYLYTPALRGVLDRSLRDFDLVHTHMPFHYPTAVAGRAAIATATPLFYHQRGVFDPDRLKFRSAKKRIYIATVERPIMRRATTLIALTAAERDSYRALGVSTPCRIISNGIDVPAGLEAIGAAQVPSWFPRDDETVILFLGRLHPIKGADLLLEAFSRVAERLPKAVLVLAGPDEFGLRAAFRARAADARLADRVRFPGVVAGEWKQRIVSRADLFCLPSLGEGFSMAILEALASGTPAMISPGCHFPEVAERGAGFVVTRSVEAWTDALATTLAEPQLLRRRRSAAVALVRDRYTWDRVVDQLEDCYVEGVARCRANDRGVAVGGEAMIA